MLYLTAGYECFMRGGVVDRLHRRTWLSGMDHQVIGSGLTFADGAVRPGHIVDGGVKAKVVQHIPDAGGRIALLADDDHHDLLPFDEVERRGGRVLRVEHESGRESSPSWAALVAESEPDLGRSTVITRGSSPAGSTPNG